jgi:hypothetical protein
MAHGGRPARVAAAADLYCLGRLPRALQCAVVVAVLALCGVLGTLALRIQEHYAQTSGGGRVAALLAHGSSPATAWAGWAAALFFLVALVRVRRGAPEPPAGRTPVESLTAAQLRAGLKREYTSVRVALLALTVVALADTARAARYVVAAAGGEILARASLAATLVEAAGLLVAALLLALWALTFREQLVRVGALR